MMIDRLRSLLVLFLGTVLMYDGDRIGLWDPCL